MRFYQITLTNHSFVASLVRHDDNWCEVLLGGFRTNASKFTSIHPEVPTSNKFKKQNPKYAIN